MNEAAIDFHRKHRGKIEVRSKIKLTRKRLSLAYTPGVAIPVKTIANDPDSVYDLTIKQNSVAVITDGSAILGLGNKGPYAALPVMEGKCTLFKDLGNVDAFPICLDTQDTEEIVRTVKYISPVFGGINLEDIAAPKCFEIEARLQDIGIPVMHDDQHATAIVIQAALQNAAKVVGKKVEDLKVVINGAGAAGISAARMLHCINIDKRVCISVNDTIVCDSKGIIHKDRGDLNEQKRELAEFTNREGRKGGLPDAMIEADVFIGLSTGNIVTADMVKNMASDPIIFAMANPVPEMMPSEAKKGGAKIIGTGRSDFPNQINNALAFPGVFRGALDAKATKITKEMMVAAAQALAKSIKPKKNKILPSPLDKGYVEKIAKAVAKEARRSGITRK